MRLYKYLKFHGNYTKGQITELNSKGLILVNNEKKGLLYDVLENDIVTVSNKPLKSSTEYKYFLYYKPKGIICEISDKENSYIKNINLNYKLSLAGRLDKDSEGLMIVTNDGYFINELMMPNNHIKEYIVTLKNEINDDFLTNIQKSYILDNRKTIPFVLNRVIDKYNIDISLYEGIYHQIRRIVKINNNKVINLKRIRIANYFIDDLKPGEIKEIKKGN